MRISDGRYARDMRRYELARRMLEYEARTMTIAAWTGLTKYRIQTLFREYEGIGPAIRHRGISPFQSSVFSRTLELECESSVLAGIELELQVVPEEVMAEPAAALPSLTRGERLVDAFDLYRALVPVTHFTLEHALLLAKELSQRKVLTVSCCDRCDGVMIVDLIGSIQEECAFCRLDKRTTDRIV